MCFFTVEWEWKINSSPGSCSTQGCHGSGKYLKVLGLKKMINQDLEQINSNGNPTFSFQFTIEVFHLMQDVSLVDVQFIYYCLTDTKAMFSCLPSYLHASCFMLICENYDKLLNWFHVAHLFWSFMFNLFTLHKYFYKKWLFFNSFPAMWHSDCRSIP